MSIRAAAAVRTCDACEATEGSAAHYVRRILCEPRYREPNARAIAEALGFCPAHAAFVAAFDEHAARIGAVTREALAIARTLLRPHGREMEERLLEILFAAPNACPACRFKESRLASFIARRAAALRSRSRGGSRPHALCLPHFHALLGASELSDLSEWVAMEIDLLSDAQAALEADGPGVLLAVTRWVAGRRSLPPMRGASLATRCRVCLAARAAKARWLALLRESMRTDAAPGMLLPLCGEHIWDCHSTGDARLAAQATRNALEVASRRLRKAAARLREEEEQLELAKRSVWYKPKSAAYILGHRRRVIAGGSRCAACERIAVACDRAVSELLEDQRGLRAREHECCMKHFACARVIAPAGATRESLTDAQLAALSGLERELAAAPEAAWKQALGCFSGSI